MVKDGTACRQGRQSLGLADIKDWVNVLSTVCVAILTVSARHWDTFETCGEGAGYHPQRSVVFAHIIQRNPATQELSWLAPPVRIVLMPLHIAPERPNVRLDSWLVQRLVMKELQSGCLVTHQLLSRVQHLFVVE